MKINYRIIFRPFVLLLIESLILFVLGLSGIKNKLLQDKKLDVSIDEGKYILNILTSDYEEYLKIKKEDLEKEKILLLSKRNIQRNYIEKQKIRERLIEIEKEKIAINFRLEKNQELKRLVEEARSSNADKRYYAYKRIITEMNQDYLNLLEEKKQLESYWKEYVNDLLIFFTEEYEKDPSKKAEIEDKFKIDNGKKYIFDEYNNIYKLSKKIEAGNN